MSKSAVGPILQLISPAVEDQRHKDLPDAELLRRFRTERDEAAFCALLRRHGSMVLQVCRNLLGTDEDAEDAFQATFLVLARKAATIRQKSSVGSWLYGVTYRTALKARAEFARRQKHESRGPAQTPATAPDEMTWREVQQILHAELNRLSERYRAPLALCYLEGKTQDEAASLLGLSKATLKKSLERGRSLLRVRLTRRGLGALAILVASAWPSTTVSACLQPALVSCTIKAAALFAARRAAATSVNSAQAAALAEGVLKAMYLTKSKTVVALLCAGLLVAGVATTGLIYRAEATEQTGSRKEAQSNGPSDARKDERDVVDKQVDAVGIGQPDERALTRITAPTDGKVEKIYKATGEQVRKGETLVELDSPDVLVTTRNLLDAQRSGNTELQRIARDRFRLWGIDDDQVDRILKGGKAVGRLTIVAPLDGKVVRTHRIRGDHVKAGDAIYDVADISVPNAKERQPPKGAAGTAKVQELLKERHAVLQEAAKIAEQDYRKGTVSHAQVMQAHMLVLKSEIDLSDSPKARLAVHEKIVDVAKAIEKGTTEAYKAGKATQVDVLNATASRLEAEIAFERAKAQVTPPTE